VGAVVEIDEIARSHVDCSCTEPRHPRVDAIEVNQALQRALQRAGVVEAGCFGRAAGVEPWQEGARGEEPVCAACRGKARAHLVEDIARILVARIEKWVSGPIPRCSRSYPCPEIAQPINTRLGRVARDDRGIDRADGNAGNPIGVDASFRQRLVHPAW
jgi:hypothetical protein